MMSDRPPFLECVGDAERTWWRPLVVLIGGSLAAAVAIGVAMAAVLGIASLIVAWASGGATSVAEASRILSDFGRTGRGLQSYAYELASVGIGSMAAGWAFIAVAARVARRPWRSFLTIAPRFRWRLVWLGLAVAAPVLAASVLVSRLGAGPSDVAPIFTPGAALWARLVYVAASAVFLCLAALAEEMLFRGWLLQQTSAFVRNTALLLAINGLLFSAAHLDPNLGGFLIRAAMGAAWSWVVLRTGGLEFALGAHLANNLMVSLFVKPVSLAPVASRSLDYRELAIEVVGLALIVGMAELLVRRRSMGVVTQRAATAAGR